MNPSLFAAVTSKSGHQNKLRKDIRPGIDHNLRRISERTFWGYPGHIIAIPSSPPKKDQQHFTGAYRVVRVHGSPGYERIEATRHDENLSGSHGVPV